MNIKIKIAFTCYFIANLVVLLFGIVYSFKGSFMPYHEQAIGMAWSDVPDNFQVLIIALMRAFGGACIALSVAIFIILFKQFPNGACWVKWCIPLSLSIASLGGMHAMTHVMMNTSASPPWLASVLIIFLSIIGYIFSTDNKQHKID